MVAKRKDAYRNTTSLQNMTSSSPKTILRSHSACKKVRRSIGCQDHHIPLVMIDTFKGQYNDTIDNLCANNNCAVVIVPHNLTNKFEPLNIAVNKPAKCFISEKYNYVYVHIHLYLTDQFFD